jgi:hypothetical protein
MEIYKNGTNMGAVRLLDSPHSQQNTLAVTAILDHFGISVEQVDNSLSTFKGVKRRNEVAVKIAAKYGLPIIDLYSISVEFAKFRTDDGVHFNADGYRKFAEQIISDLKNINM